MNADIEQPLFETFSEEVKKKAKEPPFNYDFPANRKVRSSVNRFVSIKCIIDKVYICYIMFTLSCINLVYTAAQAAAQACCSLHKQIFRASFQTIADGPTINQVWNTSWNQHDQISITHIIMPNKSRDSLSYHSTQLINKSRDSLSYHSTQLTTTTQSSSGRMPWHTITTPLPKLLRWTIFTTKLSLVRRECVI